MNIDYLTELEPFMDHFENYRIRGNKLQSCSPFRYEKRPSFAVNLENGTWIDSGAPSEEHYKGNFTSLLCYLRQESYSMTAEYLQRTYGYAVHTDKPEVHCSVGVEDLPVYDWRDMKDLHYRSPYLARRGVSEEAQRLFCIGYDKDSKAIAMPWFNLDKKVINVKFRSTYCKKFWYLQEGQLIRKYLYGLPQVISRGHKDVALVESEIDAMYLWSNGIPAIAAGHAGLNDIQLEQLRHAGLKSITLAMDNDIAGNRFREQCKEYLKFSYNLYDIQLPLGAKDVNEVPPQELKEIFNSKTYVKLEFKMEHGKVSKEDRMRIAKERKRRALERKKKETEDRQS